MQNIKKWLSLTLATVLCLVCMTSCADRKEKPIATFGEYDVLYDELRYLVLTQKDIMKAAYGDSIFDTPESAESYRSELEDAVLEKLTENYVVLAACNHYLPDLKIDDDTVTDAVDDFIADAAQQVGDEETFFEMSEAYYMTERFIRFTAAVSIMEDLLRQELANRSEIDNLFADTEQSQFADWIRAGNGAYVQHIFIRNDVGESAEDNRNIAKEAREKLIDGSLTVSQAVGSAVYNQDPSNTSPYYLIRDVYDPALENAALALEQAGEVSDVVETEDGFYVFVCIEDKDELILKQKISTLLSSHQWSRTEQIKENFRDEVSFEWTEYGNSIDFLTIE